MGNKISGLMLGLVILICLLTACTKYDRAGQMNTPGIVLTFDDDRIDNWFQYLPLLDSAGVKATFYICKYNRFSPEQKARLRVIQNHGHEIAYHTTNHYNMLEYVYKYKHPIEELMKSEIEDGLKLMNRDGFYPVTFAYPYGAHNGVFDRLLKRYFTSVRSLNGTNDYTKSLAPTEKNDVLCGLGIDKSSNRSDASVLRVIQSARDNNSCAVLVAHGINQINKLSVTRERLLQIFAAVKQLQLKYYTASEISN